MNKLINFIAFFLVAIIVVFMLIPTKTINRESAAYVEHDWDSLESVIIGTPNMLSVPQYNPSIANYEFVKSNEKIVKEAAGQPLNQVNPFLYSKVLQSSDVIAAEIRSKNIQLVRMNPDVLDATELQYMKYVQQGNDFLFPKDAVLVIGNTVIECAQRVPMRDKERYIVRKIFKPLLKEDPSIRYISVPVPSPSFPEKGLYLEGSDVLIDGYNIYVGVSGKATSPAGVRWLQSTLGPKYKVYQIDIKDFTHLDLALTLIRPGLAVRAQDVIVGEMPKPLRKWEFIDISKEEAAQFAASILVAGPNKVYVDERFESLIAKLKEKEVIVTPVPFEEISYFGGGLGSFASPIRRSYSSINDFKFDAEHFKSLGNDILDNVKEFDYAAAFTKLKDKVMNKVGSIIHK